MAESESAELATEVDNVCLSADTRVGSGLDRILFGGQSE